MPYVSVSFCVIIVETLKEDLECLHFLSESPDSATVTFIYHSFCKLGIIGDEPSQNSQ